MTLSNELKIGLVVIAALVVAFFGFRFMNDEPLLSSVNLLNTKFDNVDGLLVGSTVTMNGFKVGSVRDMILSQTKTVFMLKLRLLSLSQFLLDPLHY